MGVKVEIRFRKTNAFPVRTSGRSPVKVSRRSSIRISGHGPERASGHGGRKAEFSIVKVPGKSGRDSQETPWPRSDDKTNVLICQRGIFLLRVLDSQAKNPIMKSGSGGFTAACFNIRFGFAQGQAVNIDLDTNNYAVLCSGEGCGGADDSARIVVPIETE